MNHLYHQTLSVATVIEGDEEEEDPILSRHIPTKLGITFSSQKVYPIIRSPPAGLIFHKVLPVTHPNCQFDMKFFLELVQKTGNLKIYPSTGLVHSKSTRPKNRF